RCGRQGGGSKPAVPDRRFGATDRSVRLGFLRRLRSGLGAGAEERTQARQRAQLALVPAALLELPVALDRDHARLAGFAAARATVEPPVAALGPRLLHLAALAAHRRPAARRTLAAAAAVGRARGAHARCGVRRAAAAAATRSRPGGFEPLAERRLPAFDEVARPMQRQADAL